MGNIAHPTWNQHLGSPVPVVMSVLVFRRRGISPASAGSVVLATIPVVFVKGDPL